MIPSFQKHAAELNFELVAVSDIWSVRREAGAQQLQKLGNTAPITCRNNDELYARKDVDAVIVATADFHWHVHIWPRISNLAGLELGTGIGANTVLPEDAAAQLR